VANGIASLLSTLHGSTTDCHHKDMLRKAMGHGPLDSFLRRDELITLSVIISPTHTDNVTKPRVGKRDEAHLA